MSLNIEDVVWYNRDYDRIKPIFSCGYFHNVHVIGTKGGINYNNVLSLCQLGYPLKDKPDDSLLEDFLLDEGDGDPELLKRIRRTWGKVHLIVKKELGKQNCIYMEPYTDWIKAEVKIVKISYPWEPSISLKPPRPSIVHVSEVDKLKDTTKLLEK